MKYLFFIFTSALFFSCSEQPEEGSSKRDELKKRVGDNSDTLDERTKYYLENTKVNFADPIVLNSAENIVVPVELEEIYVEKEMPEYSYFNFAILNKDHQFIKYLFDKSVVIRSYETIEENVFRRDDYYDSEYRRRENPEFNSLLFFDLWELKNRKQDYRRLFVYNLKTDSLRQLSLPETNVLEWEILPGKNAIYMKYSADTNHDGAFDEKDDANIIFVNLSSDKIPNETFNLNELKKLKLKVAIENK